MGTIANRIDPFYPIHPGEIIKDEIEFRGISQRKLAEQMGISYTQFNELLNGKRSLNTETALLIEAALGLEPVALVNMQTRYNMQVARQDNTLAKRLEAIRNLAASLM
ncbi:hypothetical protein A3BBH6_06370 [Alistipes onderdonkii subsp. vulgaris]|uniref:HigA family addiction module antitoxin n=1 Tax=Alistipes onderdonkii TaxID=328813 RepID=UPI001145007C|nr:HigA family addiction module antitoxin [Alistipes onderdonkii]BBL00401.1 hypothetical protein A3BBH6_06370 [Alistipes onderdonkii subsp. vulgaris]